MTAGREAFIAQAIDKGATQDQADRAWVVYWVVSSLIAIGYTAKQIGAAARAIEAGQL